MRRDTGAALLVAFGVAAGVDLASLAAGFDAGHLAAKPLLMPLLAAYAYTRGAPRPLLAALLFGWGGDVLLLSDAEPAFLAGMGSFAAGHVCYLVLFAGPTGPGRSGQPAYRVAYGLAYALALVVAVVSLWPGLPAELRLPVACYSALLTTMAWAAARLGPVAGLGGALFVVSDMLIATGVAEWPQPPRPDLWIMLTYLAAQYLLTRGVLDTTGARAPSTPAEDEVPRPTV
ncbi:lysoplasmalogenase [Streptomyces caniscabiei]|uniref:Lysoplasmalogenase n=1 Tax=Streptomyces caniscabiei TaxID=2746961 RepID=A0A927LD90_9ACTN|nr:lysoplasmalogenase [Streptomyces caniscabiei]MBD9729603.1 lysoplasmalogenase [Streptomyces caniscabiei]MDX3515358.1 lysoplasmalogenase [Streptomyces caniscabiei]MDX3724259.1 lysoplasmalogenase [Streptomyces caniscabiei]WEO27967.1 lysoplasmalogenase [Streptomyces caniscabiei]